MNTPIFRYAFILCLSLLIAFPVFAASPAPHAIRVNKVVAVVNGEMVTLHELRRNSGPELARAGVNPTDPASADKVEATLRQVLALMIDDILLRQEAERLKITVNDSEVDNELRKLVQRNQTTIQDFERRLVAQGGSIKMLKERLRNSILSQRIVSMMISRKVVVTKEEVAKYFEEHKSEFSSQKSANISLIVFAPTTNADDVVAQITSGSLDFSQAAKQYSIGPASTEGGNLGLIPWKDLASPIRAEVAQLKDGQISNVFMLDLNKAVVRMNSSTQGSQMALEEATPDIERILREPRLQERFNEYTKQLRSKAVVDIRF